MIKFKHFFVIGLITATLGACSSTGSKTSSTDTGRSSKASDKGDLDLDSPNSDKATSGSEPTVDQGPSKKELYDGIQISLGSSDDALVEKSVANTLSHDQGDAKALNALGLYHLSKGRHSLAKMIFKSILDKDPKNAGVQNNIGVLYYQEGERRLAIDAFRKAIQINPSYAIASANLGNIFANGRDYSKAKQLLETAYRGGVKDLVVLNNYAAALMFDGKGDAESIFKEALQVGSSDGVVNFNYALYLVYIKKDYKQAGEIIDKIRFMGIPGQKKAMLTKMEETISGHGSEETKAQ